MFVGKFIYLKKKTCKRPLKASLVNKNAAYVVVCYV